MNAGLILLWIAAAAGAASLALAAWRPSWARLLARAHASAVLGALVLLVVAFLTTDLALQYVWAHTRADLPLAYKLAGVWGGEEGTILLWDAGVCVALLVVARHTCALNRRAAWILLAFSTALVLVQLASGSFAGTSPNDIAAAPRGRGLAEVLETPLMAIHPPIQFLGYALMSVPAAFALASWLGPTEDAWIRPAMIWARVAWLFATVGLGLGALWAYYVLSFGGYWAWDPVEVSNLLPWLALTAFLHAGKYHEKFGDHPLSAPILAVSAWILTLFATFATRSGLWVSVHAFTDPTGTFEPDASARLLAILGVHAPTRAFTALLTAAVLAALALYLLDASRAMRGAAGRAYARAHASVALALAGAAALDPRATWSWLLGAAALVPNATLGLALVGGVLLTLPLAIVYLEREESVAKRGTARLVMSIAVALFAIALVATFLVNMHVVNGPDRALFDVRAPFVVLPMVSALTVMLALGPLGTRRALALAAAGALGGLLAWWLAPGARTLALAAPFLVAAAVATILKLAQVQGRTDAPKLRAAGALVLAASLLGIVQAANPLTFVGGVELPRALTFAYSFVALPLAILGIAGAVAAFRARGRALAIAGALGAMLSIGFGLGALLAFAGLVLIASSPRRLIASATWPEGARLRETGIYVIHLAVILGLLGYAASTYSQTRETFAAAPVGSTVHVGAYDAAIGAARESTSDAVDAVAVPLALDRGGASAGSASLAFAWHETHYSPALDVRRAIGEDVYVSPLAFHTASGWSGATSATETRVAPGDVDAVTFTVAVLPLMSLVWSGLWMGAAGMTLVLAGAKLEAREHASGDR